MRDFWLEEFAKSGITEAEGKKFEELTDDELIAFGRKCVSGGKFSILSNPYEEFDTKKLEESYEKNGLDLNFANDFLNTLNRVKEKENENLETFFKAFGIDPKATDDKKKKKK